LQLYVINLDRSPDRLARITKVFAGLGLEFTRVAAVDGNMLDETEYQSLIADSRLWDLPLTRNEVGCFLSHRECLRLGVEQGDPYFAIFEDDVTLSPHITRLLKEHDWIKSGTDMIKLDTANADCKLKPLRKTGVKPYRCGRLVSEHCCAGGYIVSRQAAIRLLSLTQRAFSAIDNIYFDPYCGILQTLNVQQLVPAPVIQAGLESDIWKNVDLSLGARKRTKISPPPPAPPALYHIL